MENTANAYEMLSVIFNVVLQYLTTFGKTCNDMVKTKQNKYTRPVYTYMLRLQPTLLLFIKLSKSILFPWDIECSLQNVICIKRILNVNC